MKLNDFSIAENTAYNFIFSIDIYKQDQSVNKIKTIYFPTLHTGFVQII